MNSARVNESPNVDVQSAAVTIVDSDCQESKTNATSSTNIQKEKRKRESRADLYR